MKTLSETDILQSAQQDIAVQSYQKKAVIEGVQIFNIKHMAGEDGTFEELTRLDEQGNLQVFPDFKVRQINRSRILPNAIKAWHLHFNQEDIWYVSPENHMLLGLWDVREQSVTKEQTMKIVMGGGSSKLVYIPRGVAHGVVNLAQEKGTIIYLVNQRFDLQNPDERRLPWDKLGADFWEPQKG